MSKQEKKKVLSETREYELKLMLIPEEYRAIDSMFPGEKTVQVNTYFDTPDFRLHDKKTVVRLRERSGRFELTVKTLNKEKGREGAIDITERTIILDDKEASMLLSGKMDIGMYLTAFADITAEGLAAIGSLVTTRKLIQLSGGLPPAELDESIYCGRTDHELEWEISDEEYDAALKVLTDLGLMLEGRGIGGSKYGRFVECIRKGGE